MYNWKQLPPYIPGILSSDILSKPWRHYINEHIIQPHVDKNARVWSHDDSRLQIRPTCLRRGLRQLGSEREGEREGIRERERERERAGETGREREREGEGGRSLRAGGQRQSNTKFNTSTHRQPLHPLPRAFAPSVSPRLRRAGPAERRRGGRQTANGWIPGSRQWPEVYDLCHTFLHVAQVKKLTAMREL